MIGGDKKTSKDSFKIADADWKSIADEVENDELREAAAYRIMNTLYEMQPERHYSQRQADANRMVQVLGHEKTDEIIEVIKSGKQTEEIITALSPRDGGKKPAP